MGGFRVPDYGAGFQVVSLPRERIPFEDAVIIIYMVSGEFSQRPLPLLSEDRFSPNVRKSRCNQRLNPKP